MRRRRTRHSTSDTGANNESGCGNRGKEPDGSEPIVYRRDWTRAGAAIPQPLNRGGHQVDRRRLIAGSAAMPLVLSAKWPWAVALAAQDRSLPKELQDVGYDGYRAIRFRPERALWHGEGIPFEVQFFNRGFIFTDRVEIYEVSGGRARLIPYSPDLFDFGTIKLSQEAANVGFAGFRLHAPMNR